MVTGPVPEVEMATTQAAIATVLIKWSSIYSSASEKTVSYQATSVAAFDVL